MEQIPTDFLAKNLGVPYIGMLVAVMQVIHPLYGFASLQTVLFFRNNRGDSRLLKTTVAILWHADTFHTILNAHTLYYYLVSNYGNFLVLEGATWSILLQIYIPAFSDTAVRLCVRYHHLILPELRPLPTAYSLGGYFFVILKKYKTLAYTLFIVINLLSISATGEFNRIFPFFRAILSSRPVEVSASVFASLGFKLRSYFRFREIAWALYSGFGCSSAADTFIAISLSTFLIRSRTGVQRTDSMLSFLLALTINTGLLTRYGYFSYFYGLSLNLVIARLYSICALGCLVTFAVWPNNLTFFGIFIPLNKLYLNSLLASLNARGVIGSMANNKPREGQKFITTPVIWIDREVTEQSFSASITGQKTHEGVEYGSQTGN
ncbi:hypothetical protein NLJ89_g5940 [Agrocybe chaxingu]|uniref:DUF6534 domain-containing protein n=1 Tax=Agrocybe chaxingu TaxID=84603 RepID=A0A9W8JXF8_9AGAR|nr:hypothetical protein NLJ89_g5940 [Agrocybe chaxingu]